MNKSVIIILTVLWLLCTLYFTLARTYGYPYMQAAVVGSWVSSGLLLVCILIYMRKHKQKA